MKSDTTLRPETIARIQELKGFKSLEKGWDGYKADPISAEAEQMGLTLLCALDPLTAVASIVPGPSDELQLNFQYGSYEVELVADDIDLRWIATDIRDLSQPEYITTKGKDILEALKKGLVQLSSSSSEEVTKFTQEALDHWLSQKTRSGWEGLDADAIINDLRS